MLTLGGYTLVVQLHQGRETAIYRGTRESDGAPIVAKLLRTRLPSAFQVAKLRHEFTLLANLSHPGVVRVHEFVERGGRAALIMEDPGGLSLSQLLAARELALGDSLQLAVQLAAAVAAIHAEGVLHLDIKPQNVIVHPDDLAPKLIDFGTATRIVDNYAAQPQAATLEGTLAYMPPEQTGRTSLPVDQRSDLYSLGMTLYQLFTRAHPFDSREPLELIYAQIARVPPPMHELRPAIPPQLSLVVAKLVAKDPNARYQTARGLVADLVELSARWQRRASDLEFPLARQDRVARLRRPRRLQGREAELERASSAFAAARQSGARLLAITGPAGVGKSTFIAHLGERLALAGATRCAGKCDQAARGIPYAPLAAALRDLIAQMIALPEAAFTRWRDALRERAAAALRALVELVPELERVCGPCPPLHEVSPSEAKSRFYWAIRGLLEVSAAPERPLVITIEDLQWIDPASLELLRALLAEPRGLPVFIMASWRQHEAAERPQIEWLRGEGATIDELAFESLGLAGTAALVADILASDEAEVEGLAELVYARTLGNPFFTEQLLQSLHERGLLCHDGSSGRWSWDAAALREAPGADDVVELMLARLKRLSGAARSALQAAACVGHRFELAHVAHAIDAPLDRVVAALAEALRAGLIVPLQGDHHLLDDGMEDPALLAALAESGVAYRFLHDRVQQAAGALLGADERRRLHRRIGEGLCSAEPETLGNERLFALLSHLGHAASLYDTCEERLRLARLHLLGGARAREGVAFDAAITYFRAGVAALGDDAWSLDRRLRFELGHGVLVCAAFHDAHAFDEAELAALEAHAVSPLERARVEHVRLQVDIIRGRPRESIEAGLCALAALGVVLPTDEQTCAERLPDVMRAIREQMAGRCLEALLSLPPILEPALALTVQILADLSSPTNLSYPALYGLVIATQAELSLRHGHAAISSYSYMVYAYYLATTHRAHAEAREVGQFALALLERWGAGEVECKTRFVFTCFAHLQCPLPAVVEQLECALQAGVRSGDAVYLSYACSHLLLARLDLDEPLSALLHASDGYFSHLEKTRVASSMAVQQVARQFIACLQGRTRGAGTLSADGFDDEAFFAAAEASGLTFAVRWQLLARLELLVLFGHGDQALDALRAAERKLSGRLSFYFATKLPWLAVLALALAHPNAAPEARAALRREVGGHRDLLAEWAELSPENYAAPLALVDAEIARLDGADAEALRLYEAAAARAQAGRMLSLTALALERCGLFYLERGLQRPALAYLRDACAAYYQWEAHAKVQQLSERFGPLLQGTGADELGFGDGRQTTGHSSSSTRDQLDLTSAFKGAQALAGEMNLERLLAKVVPIAIENTGAERGVLVLRDPEGELSPAADFGIASGEAQGGAPMTIVRAVCRTGALVVLRDASADPGAFRDDPYLRGRQVRSVLCTALVHQGQPLGALYLENSLAAGVFTAHHTRVLHVLASQAAIAIENARLYKMLAEANRALEQRVRERTAELTRTLEHLRAAQHQLVESEKLAALGTLVAGIAHEISTPIGVGVTAASVLIERSDGISESYNAGKITRRELERYVDTARQSSAMLLSNLNRAAELIQSFKQVAVDQSSEEKRTFVVRAYIDHVLLSLRPELKRTRLKIEVEGDPQVEIHSYPGAFSQILTNLIMNSLTHAYAPDEAGTLWIRFHEQERGLALEYGDDGCGIEPEHLARIFDPFFTTRRDHGGSGLGLHIVYNLVTQRLGGTIRCTSSLGGGTRFTLFIAAFPAPAPEG